MKKRMMMLCALVCTMCLTGCYVTIPKVETYTISYYVNGQKENIEPSTYEKGEEVQLGTYLIEPGKNISFSGWYDNEECIGKTYSHIATTDTGNKTFYGKTITYAIDSLSEALSSDNYAYTVSISSSGISNEYICAFQQGNISQLDLSYSDTPEYLVQINQLWHYIFCEEGTWYAIDETDSDYIYYIMVFQTIDLGVLSANDFVKVDTTYQPQEGKLQSVAKQLLGDYDNETFLDFSIALNERGQVSLIVAHSTYVLDGETLEYTYQITFSNHGQTEVKAPDAVLNGGALENIASAYQLSTGANVTVSGVVTGIYGNNFYLNDGTKGILIYMGSNTDYTSEIVVGQALTVAGTIDIYKNVHQIKDVTSVITSDETYIVEPIVLNHFNQATLADYANDLVNVTYAQLASLPTNYATSGKDVSFEVELGGNTITVFFSKHLDSNTKTALFNVLQTMKVGDAIRLSKLHIGYYNGYQLVVTSATTFDKGYQPGDPIVLTSLELTADLLSVEVGTTLSDILNQVGVYAVYNNGEKVLLAPSAYTYETKFKDNTKGEFPITFTYEGKTKTCRVTVREAAQDAFYPNITQAPIYSVLDQMGYDSETGITYGITKGLPSTGDVDVLVIPIEFTDCLAPKSMVKDLETAFFGTSEATGWESLNSYYLKSSYGKLNIQGTVLEPFQTGHTVSYYNQLQAQYNRDLERYENYETDVYPDNVEFSIIEAALAYYDSQIDYAKYDSDQDGYIDSIYLVYTTDYDAQSDNSLWWAFTTEYYTETEVYYDGVQADFYMFMSYQFIFDELQGQKVQYNAETIIHETGHLLGLDDYYDYDETTGPSGGIGGGDMMDYNVGDHNAYSKLMLGWVTPLVVTGKNTTVELESFAESGDCVIICKEWNGTFFDEYYIIDFYTPTNLNAFAKGESGLFSIAGIRIYHIDATLNQPADCYDIFSLTLYNNSYSAHRLITLVEADGRNDISKKGYSENSDLFQQGTTYRNATWYDNSSAQFTIHIDQILAEKATITISFQ